MITFEVGDTLIQFRPAELRKDQLKTPSGCAGSLRITSFDGLVLTVRGDNGASYDLDIQEGTYTAPS